jgi:AcrR family transcriptional regulator
VSALTDRMTAAATRLFADRGSLDITVSELAVEAQVARGTLYRNIDSIEKLFSQVVDNVCAELHVRVASALDEAGISDPAVRLATALRLVIRLTRDDPAMAQFVVRFGLTDESIHAVLAGRLMSDVDAGCSSGRYTIHPHVRLATAFLISGTIVSAMQMTLDGHTGWRDAGSGAAEFVLRALGISAGEARNIAGSVLPALSGA